MFKKFKFGIIVFICILFIFFSLNIILEKKYSRDKMIDLIKNANIPNNLYIENIIYENNFNSRYSLVKFYIKDNMEYIYQENNNENISETYIDNKNNTSIIVLNSEKIITKNNIDTNSNLELPFTNTLLEQLNNYSKYNYSYCNKEKLNGIDCIKISLVATNLEGSIYNYYIDKNTGYVIQYESCDNNNNIKQIGTYKYEINAVTDDQLHMFNLNNYNNYTLYGF